ncbi:MAG TPA: hypothetical protein VF881_07020 [Polyangiaceae bacterium]
MDRAKAMRKAACLIGAATMLGCGGSPAEATTPCEQECRDAVALRAIRETAKFVFNKTLQGETVGMHDETLDCLTGGTARIFGVASSNAVQGATEVKLAYQFDACGYFVKHALAERNYDMTLTGTITEEGTLAVQPTATTALLMKTEAMTFSGAVYDPPAVYEEPTCPVELAQNGNDVSGTICGRMAGFSF